ncbi:MAG: hypothetical protein ACJAU7_001474 [Parvibaculaceae bacterium]|jgi:hypothetical protein
MRSQMRNESSDVIVEKLKEPLFLCLVFGKA